MENSKYTFGYLPKIEYWTNQLLNDNCDPDRVQYIAEKLNTSLQENKQDNQLIRKKNLKNKDMKVIKTIVLGLGLLIIYPIVLVNRITIKSVKVEALTADYVEYFCKSFN